ncbi:MAG: hypothetical protein ACI4T1_03675 [Christensenellales bacterium]
MDKKTLKNKLFNFLGSFDHKIRTKLDNICGKTGQYDVPDELYQKRTSRKNRVLISWKTVKNNNFTIQQLESFSGGVAVEFVNEDFFEETNQNDPLFVELKNRLGSDEIVSSIITIRSESGSSSSFVQRQAFEKLINNTRVIYKGTEVVLNIDNYKDYGIKQIQSGGMGNEKWTGFLFVSIKGGQQDVIKSHDCQQTIFNPACDFANEEISLDLDLTMSYFAMLSIDVEGLEENKRLEYSSLFSLLKETLSEIQYDNESFTGTLLEYCENHPSAKMVAGKLYDPIQVEEIHILDFAVDNKEDPKNLDFTHDEAVNKGKYYWDNINQCILSPARPTNVFWSKHLSNMMQQNFSLNEYFRHEEDVANRRRRLLNN